MLIFLIKIKLQSYYIKPDINLEHFIRMLKKAEQCIPLYLLWFDIISADGVSNLGWYHFIKIDI